MNLSKWTKNDIVAALERSGYYENEIISANFAGVNDSNKAMFDIAYDNDGIMERGRVFVFIDATGELVADY